MSIQTNEAVMERTAFMLPTMMDDTFTSEEFEDMEGLQMSFQRVKIPGGGVLQFEMVGDNPDNPEYVRNLEGVILYRRTQGLSSSDCLAVVAAGNAVTAVVSAFVANSVMLCDDLPAVFAGHHIFTRIAFGLILIVVGLAAAEAQGWASDLQHTITGHPMQIGHGGVVATFIVWVVHGTLCGHQNIRKLLSVTLGLPEIRRPLT